MLRSGEAYSMEFKYDTTLASTSEATLVLKTKAQPDGAARVALQGKTVSSFLGVEPMELDFLWVDLGTPSEARTITLTNQSDKAMRVSLLENTNPAFVVNADALGAELAPGEQAQLHVTFLSNTGGEATGELRLALNSNSTADVAIKLKGQSRTLQGEGGGCACGAGGGGASLLGLLGLVALRARRRSRAD
jgi:MYXO-CTERM domain-containing protein